MENNIFGRKKYDAIAYWGLYLLVPILVSGFSLKALAGEIDDAVYCYITILLSAANCIYDGINRKKEDSPVKNTKLLFMNICTGVICVYSVAVILHALIVKCIWRLDWILLIYSIPCIIALWDGGNLLMQGTVLEHTIGGVKA